MRCFKKPWFQRFASKEGIADDTLKKLVEELEQGRAAANLGSFVYKQRLAREGAGKSGGYRIIFYYRKDDRVFFVFGFAKSDMGNVDRRDLAILKAEAQLLMQCSDNDLKIMVEHRLLMEF